MRGVKPIVTETAETEAGPSPRQLSGRPWYRWYALGVLTLVYLSSHVDRQIMAIVLEPLKQDLGASDTQMGFLVGLTFALFYATLGMPLAMLADRVNRRNIIAAAVTIWSLMTVACGYTNSFLQLALARIGVGVGEAGSSPPSHSVISDLFPLEQRSTAMGIYGLGVSLGILVAFLGGGWITEHYGWRMAFIVMGIPGLLIAALVFLTTIEPERGATEAVKRPTGPAPGFLEVWGHMWRVRSLRHLTLGAAAAAIVGYGLILWIPAFLMRSHGLSPSEVGLAIALIYGVFGGLGSFVNARLADVLGRRDERWRIWLAAVTKAGYVPLMAGMFLVDDVRIVLALYIIPAFFSNAFMAPTFALVQSLVTVRMRALASSILLFVLNLIGMGLGPQLAGVLSDLFAPAFGGESLRIALLVMTFMNLWCAWHFYAAGRTLKQDREALEAAWSSGMSTLPGTAPTGR
jgi:MFS family permease